MRATACSTPLKTSATWRGPCAGATPPPDDAGQRAGPKKTLRHWVLLSVADYGLQNSFQLMQDLFADLSRGRVAAAAGNSYTYEQRALKSGVFTHCALDYLAHHPAGSIRVNALREGVAAQVSALTQEAQKPSARVANNEFDWEL